MPNRLKAPIAVAVGLVATGVIVIADVMAWPLGNLSFSMLGTLAGGALAYLVPSPGEKHS
jgi:hypothetical protein